MSGVLTAKYVLGLVVPIPTLSLVLSMCKVDVSKVTSAAPNVAPLIVGLVKVLFVNVCVPSNKAILDVFDKSVEAIVMFPVPSNDCPAIVLAVSNAVAVAALPEVS